jgi:hypothetical protein
MSSDGVWRGQTPFGGVIKRPFFVAAAAMEPPLAVVGSVRRRERRSTCGLNRKREEKRFSKASSCWVF